MLYTSLAQPLIFVYLFLGGLACGIFFDVAFFLTFLFNKNKVAFHFFNFVATLLSFAVYYLINIVTNYGQLRLFSIFAFLFGILLQRLIFSKLICKFSKKCYNFFRGKRKKTKNS